MFWNRSLCDTAVGDLLVDFGDPRLLRCKGFTILFVAKVDHGGVDVGDER